ncbi:unnamed protein product [Staurois parvus]|uniref:Uncharacterized protein n=1 Tax=Staurois parvus TaxID=386267 RepID=A0ABN9EGD7_9NEOB|nr:unnamed protein product [Staurois parvus]
MEYSNMHVNFLDTTVYIRMIHFTPQYTGNPLTDATTSTVPASTPNTRNVPSYTVRPLDTTEYVLTQETEINISGHYQTPSIRKVTRTQNYQHQHKTQP